MANKPKTETLCVGDQVRVIMSASGGLREPVLGETVYEVTEVNGFACMIREINFVNPNVKYRPHRSDTSLLKRIMPFT